MISTFIFIVINITQGQSWSWSHGSWIYSYPCNQCLSPQTLWVRTPPRQGLTRYNIMWYSLSLTCNRSVVFSGSLHQYNRPPWYNWNIVESDIQHHKTKTNHKYNIPSVSTNLTPATLFPDNMPFSQAFRNPYNLNTQAFRKPYNLNTQAFRKPYNLNILNDNLHKTYNSEYIMFVPI